MLAQAVRAQHAVAAQVWARGEPSAVALEPAAPRRKPSSRRQCRNFSKVSTDSIGAYYCRNPETCQAPHRCGLRDIEKRGRIQQFHCVMFFCSASPNPSSANAIARGGWSTGQVGQRAKTVNRSPRPSPWWACRRGSCCNHSRRSAALIRVPSAGRVQECTIAGAVACCTTWSIELAMSQPPRATTATT